MIALHRMLDNRQIVGQLRKNENFATFKNNVKSIALYSYEGNRPVTTDTMQE